MKKDQANGDDFQDILEEEELYYLSKNRQIED